MQKRLAEIKEIAGGYTRQNSGRPMKYSKTPVY